MIRPPAGRRVAPCVVSSIISRRQLMAERYLEEKALSGAKGQGKELALAVAEQIRRPEVT